MSENQVNMVFTVNDKGAPVIKIIYDKNSQELCEKMMGVFLKAGKANNNTFTLEAGKEYHEGKQEFEIKVLGM